MLLESAIDLSNYLQVNVTAIRVYGLKCAVYLSELSRLYNKAMRKDRVNNGYMSIDRGYVSGRTGLSAEEQSALDAGLSDAGICSWSPSDPDKVKFDFGAYLKSITTDDAGFLSLISSSVTKAMAKAKASRDSRVASMKKAVGTGDASADEAMREWVDVMARMDGALDESSVRSFQGAVMSYAGDDLGMARGIIAMAAVRCLGSPQEAMRAYREALRSASEGPAAEPMEASDGVSDVKF